MMKKAICVFAACAMLILAATGCGAAGSSTYTGNDNDVFGDRGVGADNNTGANLTPNVTTSMEGANTSVKPSHPSYEQMLKNAHVHDTDGILTDGENACSG